MREKEILMKVVQVLRFLPFEREREREKERYRKREREREREREMYKERKIET